MKKVLCGIVLILVMSLACAGAALAAPVGPAGEGFSIFAEYDTDWYNTAIVGAGYGITEDLVVGAFLVPDWEEFGIYANLALGPFRLNGEYLFEEYCDDGLFSVLYTFDLDPIALGVGGGYDYCEAFDDYFFLTATAEIKLEALTIYGGVIYYPDDSDWTSFKIGASITF